MKLVKLLLLTLFLSTSLGAQSTERFIRIIGNAKKEIQASKAEVYFTVSEVKESTYNNMEGKSYAAAYGEVLMKLNEIGVDTNSIEAVLKAGGRYSKTISNNFSVKTDVSKADKMKTLASPGLQVTKSQYFYQDEDETLETALSLLAIKDAKRKAKAICDDIDMKLGNILNIEVKEGSRATGPVKDKTKMATYRVTVTFKMVE